METWRIVCFGLVCLVSKSSLAQLAYEQPPIDYGSAVPTDAVAQLAHAIDSGRVELEYTQEHGWLPSLLEQLQISPQSQLLVFSKTSLQLHQISPRTPRALYFNDDVYVGWCQRGDLIELAATDPELGAVFYTVDQRPSRRPLIERDRGRCLTCHASHRTQGVPGFLVRSIYSDHNGRPRSGTRTYVTDHTTEFEKRYGGWYVLGEHGAMRHMGNILAHDRLDPEVLDRDEGANLACLDGLCDLSPYLNEHSDLVALMILEHQSQMHNLIARATIETRIATHYDRGINEALGRPLDTVSDSTVRRIDACSERLVRYLLFADELELEGPVRGTSPFANQFQSGEIGNIRFDAQGRSLRQFDLQTRIFKYPCSYLIYSEAFDRMPDPVGTRVRERLREILHAEDCPEGFEHLSHADRKAIREILAETKPGYLEEIERN